jgi:hypothetical protein
LPLEDATTFSDLINNQIHQTDEDQNLILTLEPYQIAWLKAG